jgi:formiminotetrahydrofolate cyclodeaminase
LRVLDPSKISFDLVLKTTETIWEAVKAHLEHTSVDENDPFNQFMMAVDLEKEKDDEEIDLTEKIADCL